ncbi:MAG: glycosyltransferase [Nitriliruptorales bacterium]|nr:glycosyltransferase [Nitriliruptorales bacterium]
MTIKRVGFVATRLAGTDGVSLETEKWRTVLERLGYTCYAFAGEVDSDPQRAMVVPLAHFEDPEVAAVQAELFGSWRRDRSVSDRVHRIRESLVTALYTFIERFDLDLLIPENALAIPMHIPLGLALTQVIAETGLPVVGHHHDFSWERDRFRINACGDYLHGAFPPDSPSIRHVVINSYASEQLSHRMGLSNTVIPNVWDFERPVGPADRAWQLRKELGFGEDDTLVLQPTRVVARKWIERAIEIVRDLGIPRLVISHAVGDEGQSYAERLQRHADSLGVELVDVSHMIGVNGNGVRPYTLDDAYQAADLVTFTSGFEGFGNAFVEAVYHRRPIVVNRYSVYVADIEPKGFDVIAIDGFADADDIARIKAVLSDARGRERMTQKNFELGRRHFSYDVLANRLSQRIGSFER